MTPVRLQRPTPSQAWGRVVGALVMRELLMRFGVYRLGLVWALLEPAAHVVVLLFIFGAAAKSVLPVAHIIPFTFIGVCGYLLFRSGVERAGTSLDAARVLLSFRQVTPVALVLSRALVEQFTLMFVLVVGLAGLTLSRDLPWADPVLFVAAFLCLSVLTFGLGLTLAVCTSFFPATRKFVGFAMRGLYLISGVFFPLSALPSEISEWLSFNPLLQALELMRQGLLGRTHQALLSLPYLVVVSTSALFVGLALMRVLRRELEPS